MITELTIVVPTLNERENIPRLISSVTSILGHMRWEMIIVDDNSSDETANFVRDLAQKNENVRCIQRIGRRGLSSACIEGFLASSSPYVAVMDADGQHDEKLLNEMLTILQKDQADLVVGSRYVDGGSTGKLAPGRVKISKIASKISQWLLKIHVTDPMSGFFMFRRASLEHTFKKLSGQGFKVLLDIMVSAGKSLRVKELPYIMRTRQAGESKLDSLVGLEFFALLIDKLIGGLVPLRFFLFVLVGLTGVIVHFLILFLLFKILFMGFSLSQSIATLVAMTSNFIINNQFTYRDQRLRGRHLFTGLFTFYVACSLGAIINVQIATMLYEQSISWIFAGVVGAAVGAVWNYAMTASFTWKQK